MISTSLAPGIFTGMQKIFSSVSLVFIVLLGLSATVRAHTDVSVSEAQGMVNTNDQLIKKISISKDSMTQKTTIVIESVTKIYFQQMPR